jgi:hypothetical protein
MKMLVPVMMVLILVMPSVYAISVSVSVPEKYQEIGVGGTLYFKVDLQDQQNAGRHDISLKYDVTKGENIIVSSKELKAIETQASFLSSITIPSSAESGIYNIVVTVNDNESASAAFYIKGLSTESTIDFYMVILFTIVLIGILALYEIDRIRKDIEKQRATGQVRV